VSALVQRARPAFGLPGRIQAPNSKPRSLALVGLGDGGAAVARRIAASAPPNVVVHVLAKSAAGENAVAAIQAGGGDLQRALTSADMIFLVACRGDDVALASVVSGIARGCHHPVTAVYVVPERQGAPDREDETLKALRAGVEMLVVVSDESYVPAMIAALGD
jgi:3-hydroxyisobutyrate dehydrogenase-like beta-hydroxyacid dehydrogenase